MVASPVLLLQTCFPMMQTIHDKNQQPKPGPHRLRYLVGKTTSRHKMQCNTSDGTHQEFGKCQLMFMCMKGGRCKMRCLLSQLVYSVQDKSLSHGIMLLSTNYIASPVFAIWILNVWEITDGANTGQREPTPQPTSLPHLLLLSTNSGSHGFQWIIYRLKKNRTFRQTGCNDGVFCSCFVYLSQAQCQCYEQLIPKTVEQYCDHEELPWTRSILQD